MERPAQRILPEASSPSVEVAATPFRQGVLIFLPGPIYQKYRFPALFLCYVTHFWQKFYSSPILNFAFGPISTAFDRFLTGISTSFVENHVESVNNFL